MKRSNSLCSCHRPPSKVSVGFATPEVNKVVQHEDYSSEKETAADIIAADDNAKRDTIVQMQEAVDGGGKDTDDAQDGRRHASATADNDALEDDVQYSQIDADEVLIYDTQL